MTGYDDVNPFDVLGVTPHSTQEEISAAWKRQLRYWHPDHRGSDGETRTKAINLAYEQLKDPAGFAKHAKTYGQQRAHTAWKPPPGAARPTSDPAPSTAWRPPPTPSHRTAWTGGGSRSSVIGSIHKSAHWMFNLDPMPSSIGGLVIAICLRVIAVVAALSLILVVAVVYIASYLAMAISALDNQSGRRRRRR
jgi:hypothetical protein